MEDETKKEMIEFREDAPANEIVSPEEKDILWALTAPIESLTLEEQLEAVRRIREMRKVRLTTTKKKSELDYLLAQLTPERAAAILEQLERMSPKEKATPTA